MPRQLCTSDLSTARQTVQPERRSSILPCCRGTHPDRARLGPPLAAPTRRERFPTKTVLPGCPAIPPPAQQTKVAMAMLARKLLSIAFHVVRDGAPEDSSRLPDAAARR